MFRLFGKKSKRRQPVASAGIVVGEPGGDTSIDGRYALDDRDTIEETVDAYAIACKIIDTAATKAYGKKSGEEVCVALLSKHPGVHHMEISLNIMIHARSAGLIPGTNFNNEYEFIKL